MPRIDLLTVGEAFEDLVFLGLPHMPRSGEELRTGAFAATIGGGAVITATAASRLGLRTAIVSALSAVAARRLRADDVRVVNVKRPSEAHAVSVSLSTTRDRAFVTFDGINDRLEARLPAALARERARHVHLAFAPRRCGRWTRIVQRLRARGVSTSWDFGWNPPLRDAAGFTALLAAADFIFVNEAEAVMYGGARHVAGALTFWRRRSCNTIVKLGPRGSRWITGTGAGEPRHQQADISAPAPRVRAIDTTGAGDAFNGGFLTAWLAGRTPQECLRLGNFVGAQSTLAAGGVDGLPTRATRSIRRSRPARPARAEGARR